MKNRVEYPRFTLLSCAIEFQRIEGRMTSLTALHQQEMDFLKIQVAKIAAQGTNVLLVSRPVSRLAQDFLFERGIALVQGIKDHILDQISRVTCCPIFSSIDEITPARVSLCGLFRTQTFILSDGSKKTVMVVDECPPSLFCSILLRGGNEYTLSKVKAALLFLTYAIYSLRMEVDLTLDFGGTISIQQKQAPESLDLAVAGASHSCYRNHIEHGCSCARGKYRFFDNDADVDCDFGRNLLVLTGSNISEDWQRYYSYFGKESRG